MSEGSSLAADLPLSSVLSFLWHHRVHSKWVWVQSCSWKWLPLGVELMESFLGISRIGIGGKHFPGMSYAGVKRTSSLTVPVLLVSGWGQGEASGCGWLISSLGAVIDLNVYLGKLCLFHCYLQACHCYHGSLKQGDRSCWEVVLLAVSLLGWRPLLGPSQA